MKRAKLLRRTELKRTPMKKYPTRRKSYPGEDPAYRRWLRENCKCVVCKKLGVAQAFTQQFTKIEAAHSASGGMGTKAPDSTCAPLCMGHHQQSHSMGMPRFEARYGIDLKAEAAVHYRLFCLVEKGE